ncbi:MAG: peptide chain release factor N(5)-glutamine methyltransferase [Pirellula sp.]|nr:peptide chain release factor N(5)-glutamine methyltransferase [Pirellula sp.]
MSGNSTTQSEPWTILRLLQWTTEHLKKNGSTSPRLDAEVLLADARGCQRIDLYAAFNEEPNEDVKAKFRDFVRRRAAGEPVAYLVGKKEFYSAGPTIADVCTGSGCIAVAVAKHAPTCRVVAIDISPETLRIAQKNIELHGLTERVSAQQGDLLAPLADQSLDFVLSNPPYVSESEFPSLDRSVRDHEPKLALVAGPNGTEIIHRLIQQSADKLKDRGWWICELSPMIADTIRDTLLADDRWTQVSLVRDLAGQKRVAVAQRAPRSMLHSPSP